MGPEIKVVNKVLSTGGGTALALRFFKVVEEENSVGKNKSSAQGKGSYF